MRRARVVVAKNIRNVAVDRDQLTENLKYTLYNRQIK